MLKDVFHDRAAYRDQVTLTIKFGLQSDAIKGIRSRDETGFGQAEAPTAFPGTQNQRIHQTFGQVTLIEENFSRKLQPSPMAFGRLL
ncbi:MAG TPA: hypothetical protein PKD04_00425 [Rhodocyclaceae bacterium]|nr:hypothetical protein [Rhodocyclaceae bacterium]HMV21093.1 hypothetical protein [Rhodocyclaceae bacterium]HNE42846.1 hypothetical protein [Rhodocyclaceae bacterium]